MSGIPGMQRPVSLGETADRVAALERAAADVQIKTEAMRLVYSETIRAIAKSATIDKTKLERALDDMCDGWDGDDDDPVNALASQFALELSNEIQG